ncbi:MAG TPA: DUF2185 domain-containing protein [Gammaproteobacteria bacterium]
MNHDLSHMGTAFASKRVAEERDKVRFMYREDPVRDDDSGWKFFSGDEPQEYVDNPDNVGLYAISTIAEIDPDIVPLLNTPPPCAFEREHENGPFVDSDFEFWPEE